MLPSIQSPNLLSITAESFNPDQISAVMAQLFISISEASRIPGSLLGSIAELDISRQEAVNLLNALIAKRDQEGSAVTAESIDAVFENGNSLTSLFSSDTGSLGANLEQAKNLMADAKKLGVTIDANLCYPVIIISSDQDEEKERHLVWMSQEERLSLDMYSITDDNNYAPYLSRLNEEGSQATLYVLLDDQANLRADNGALERAVAQATEVGFRGEAAINIAQVRFASALEGVGAAIRWLLEETAFTFKNRLRSMEVKREKMAEDDVVDRDRLILLNRLMSDLDELIEARNETSVKNV